VFCLFFKQKIWTNEKQIIIDQKVTGTSFFHVRHSESNKRKIMLKNKTKV
jgi:hypothetical protein